MILDDARRLTGPSLLSSSPLVIVDLVLEAGDDPDAALAAYREELGRMRAALGVAATIEPVIRAHGKGLVVGYEAPIDVMLPYAEMSEWAGLSAAERLGKRPALELEPKRTEIEAMLEAAKSPALLAIQAEAARRGLAFLWDDDQVSLGLGRASRCYQRSALPEIADVPWDTLGAIPVALVTGTNGKTTSSRLLAHVAHEAGYSVGNTSTDAIVIGGQVVERGDCTGPFAARTVLRNPSVELAVLETARGGILRRGLAVSSCDVALITNISDDHLGTYGIDDLPAMTEVKGVTARIVPASGTVVLNAADANLVALAPTLRASVTFFADLDSESKSAAGVIANHRTHGGRAVIARGGEIVMAQGDAEESLGLVDAMPITFGGAARFNVENVLGVVGAAAALGISRDVIARALRSFGVEDNPHRGQLLEKDGVRVLLDFGHNPEAVKAVLRLVGLLMAQTPGRLFVVTGSAGDRGDREIEEVARAVFAAGPTRVFVRELADYLRGRALGDVPRLFEGALASEGFAMEGFEVVESEVAALERVFQVATAGDLVAVLVHVDREPVQAFLRARTTGA